MFFRIFVWLVFIALLAYVILSWTYKEKISKKIEAIRKTWYVIFILGALIYWSFYPASIFAEWKNFLIVAILFVLIDMFVFLSMYISKIGDNELSYATKAVAESDRLLTDNREKVKNMFYLLKKEGIPEYYQTHEEYLAYLYILLQAYSDKEGMNVKIIPFKTEQDKKLMLKGYPNLSGNIIRATLEREDTYYNDEEKMALQPVNILAFPYILEIRSESFVSEVDCLLIALLIMMFDMVIKQT
ncbi:type II toxin-antitoxin system SpoIISA family toxin [Peribacillus sp. NPDC097675]|uniref:type II toxin-antitoxin system SpoIISA family toxin n=1 Tax=Peribacillus sp. NPDC097675 TaxID=3390618 RepID=UPI003CFC7EAC